MGDDFEVGDFGQKEESLKMLDVVLRFLDEFVVKVFDGFELFVDAHGEEFLFVDNSVGVFDALRLLVLGLLVVLFFILFVFFAELVIFYDRFFLVV
jgi:membrane-anchored glycerophosphoryl diester phosphodiesterase (GDPDase)